MAAANEHVSEPVLVGVFEMLMHTVNQLVASNAALAAQVESLTRTVDCMALNAKQEELSHGVHDPEMTLIPTLYGRAYDVNLDVADPLYCTDDLLLLLHVDVDVDVQGDGGEPAQAPSPSPPPAPAMADARLRVRAADTVHRWAVIHIPVRVQDPLSPLLAYGEALAGCGRAAVKSLHVWQVASELVGLVCAAVGRDSAAMEAACDAARAAVPLQMLYVVPSYVKVLEPLRAKLAALRVQVEQDVEQQEQLVA